MSVARYDAAQLAEAVGRSARGGDPRYFLILALTELSGDDATEVLRRLVDEPSLQAREWWLLMVALVDREPDVYTSRAVNEGLRSRSIEVQQSTVGLMPKWARLGLLDEALAQDAATWLDRRLRNPRREATVAPWEITDVALTMAVCLGPQRTHDALIGWVPLMDVHDRRKIASLPPPEDPTYVLRLRRLTKKEWTDDAAPSSADPTATSYIDRVMKRLRIPPANAEVETHVEDWEIPGVVEVNEFSDEPLEQQIKHALGIVD